PIIQEIELQNQNKDEDIERLKFRYYANEEELVTAAQLGEVQAFIADREHELENFSPYRFPQQGVYFALFFNLRNEKLQGLELRQRLRSSLDIEALTHQLGIGVEGPISRSEYTNEELTYDYFVD